MAAPDSTLIDQQNDADIPTPANLSATKANAEAFRRVHRRITAYVNTAITKASIFLRLADGKGSTSDTDTVYRTGRTIFGQAQDDNSGAALQTSSFSTPAATVGKLNGLVFNRPVIVSPINMPAGSGDYRYLKIAQLVASNSGLYDILALRLIMGSWGSLPRGVIEASFGNREGLRCQWTQYNDTANCGLVAYQDATTGITTIYIKYINGFRSGSLSVTHNVQATVFDNWVEEVPTGTLVFDSFNLSAYSPTLLVDQNLTATRGYLRTGSGNKGFQLTGFKSGASQTLNTNGYLELRLEDGTILKVAVLN